MVQQKGGEIRLRTAIVPGLQSTTLEHLRVAGAVARPGRLDTQRGVKPDSGHSPVTPHAA